MTKPNDAQATDGTLRRNRPRRKGRYAYIRPLLRAEGAIEASLWLIEATRRAVARAERCAHRRPVRTSRNFRKAAARLHKVSKRLVWAAEDLAETKECIAGQPAMEVIQYAVAYSTGRWVETAASLHQAEDDVFALQEEVRLGLQTGVLVPERPAGSRPRIRLAPCLVPIGAFLLLRQPRVIERIAPILRRRRHTPRPASVRVPRRNLLGRAPPLVSISVL